MTDLDPSARGGLLPSRLERQASKTVDQLQAGASVELARIRAVEAVESAKVEAIGTVGLVAMAEAFSVSAAEAIYTACNPHAAARYSYIADSTTTAMGRVLERMSRRLS